LTFALVAVTAIAAASTAGTGAARQGTTASRRHHAHRICRARHGRHRGQLTRCPKRLGSRHRHAPARGHKGRTKRRHSAPKRRPAPHAVAAPAPRSSATTGSSLAAILATPCQGIELTPAPANLAAIRSATLCLVNQERARNGEQPLQRNEDLEEAAQTHSDDMVEEDYFDHVSPSGETPLQRIEEAGYITDPQAGYAIGENIAWATLGLATPQAIVAAWVASPEHLANILEARYEYSGIGVNPAAPDSLANGQPGAVYTQDFVVIE
jgi:uncharacterized protein YkwD